MACCLKLDLNDKLVDTSQSNQFKLSLFIISNYFNRYNMLQKRFWVYMILLIIASFAPLNASLGGIIESDNTISQNKVNSVIAQLKSQYSDDAAFRIERGVAQVALLWQASDGSDDDFEKFCITAFVDDSTKLNELFEKMETNLETIYGYLHKIDSELKVPLHLEGPEIESIDMMFGSYDISAHLTDDFYATKIAFVIALNFPHYSLDEKTEFAESWSRQDWAYARLGDMFTSRVPATVKQHISKTLTESDAYISDYNIHMGRLINDEGEVLFPKDMKLITHWGLRDELKSNYADMDRGLEKQRMVYSVMQRIVDQSIPQPVINSSKYEWNPKTNEVFDNGTIVSLPSEETTRYEIFLGNFHAMRQLDNYSLQKETQIDRAFDGIMEIPQKDVEKLFTDLLSSPQVKEVASFIKSRLGRELEPFDIWYNGFKSRGVIPENELDAITRKKYPNTEALKEDLPNILIKLGWEPKRAEEISALIVVDASRGAGHAMGSAMRGDVARLRSRMGKDGMDYKGYNIGVHELGHNVEQTITMNDVDFYMLTGVPNTSFTEATAFLFQKRDMELLGLTSPNPDENHLLALDNFWSCYEIMGVSLVDIQVWEWLYANPDATAGQLRDAVINIAKNVWNEYYAGILGDKDQTLLGIYSHMIDYPLYLPNYPMGHLINFQIEQQMVGKNIADEIERMYRNGRLTPQAWMKEAVGSQIDIAPLLDAVNTALDNLQ